MEYLSPLDASFLDLEDEDPHASLAIASVAVIDGPAPDQAAFAEALRGRLALVPRYRQKVRRVPFNLGRPVWDDDPGFDLDFHLRRTALPAPGDDDALQHLIGRIMSQRLDRERPMWEDWVIEGLPEGRWALLSKVHHSMLDGVTGNELYRLICDPGPEPRPAEPDGWQPEPTGGTALTLDALGRLAALPFDQARALLRAAADPAGTVRRLTDLVRGATALTEALLPAPPTSLSGPLGRARRYALARVPMAEIAAAARAHRVTINDVYLAAVAGAFRHLLLSRAEQPVPGAIRTLVPVNVRTTDARHVFDNRLSSMLLDLPVEIGDATGRLRAVHDRIAGLRERHEVEAGAELLTLADQEPYAMVSFLIRAAFRMPQRGLATVTTNVPGPPVPLYLLGRPIREILPYVPIAEHMRVGVAALTYRDQAAIGVTSDFATVPEAGDFAATVATEIRELATARGPAARRSLRAARPVRPAPVPGAARSA
ncbi:wax ester/triacylglycerol synthase family O-acyltransferase [Actinoplanes palleronii]|uniref:Diacylglycerol O-acyltransferase n=1 Tax=Actinoplanes palleronii TaxID=113570 RepID=A0ABQ4BBR1_9ACTN|nr:wax ester/triacylglycerol synthase family O-acyltransferase [Actinoplanes palleronii]GIE68131.1 putative diacyglycerol O-acyltransferase [Actinoplanes palleronii]